MKKAALAVLWHMLIFQIWKIDINFFKDNRIVGVSIGKQKKLLPIVIRRAISSIFQNLCDDELLGYLYDTAQNQNEAVNQIVLKISAKETFISRVVLEMGAASAIINFTDGLPGFEKLFSRLNFSFGAKSNKGTIEKDQQRIKNTNIKSKETLKQKRKK